MSSASASVGFRSEEVQNDATRPGAENLMVAAVEDDEGVRRALAFQLSSAGIDVAAYSSAEEFLKVPDVSKFDCIVVDVGLPRMNGLKLQTELNLVAPLASIIFITGLGELSIGIHAMRNGAVDFLEKPIDDETLLSSIRLGADLSRKRRAEQIQRSELETRHNSLSPREREVFALITAGLLNKQVAAELGITERTVKAHREKIMSKTAANSLAELVRMAEVLDLGQRRDPSTLTRS